MNMIDKTCEQFAVALASKEPVPGGGGVSAYVGALAVALANMVGNLTVGKKKYQSVEQDIVVLINQASLLQQELLLLVDEDARVFAPLAKAYGLPKDTEEQRAYKSQFMETALREASIVPLKIMEKCCVAIDLHSQFAEKGSAMAISDVGVGVVLAKAALRGASLNVYINTKAMLDREYAQSVDRLADDMLDRYCPLAEQIYAYVEAKLR